MARATRSGRLGPTISGGPGPSVRAAQEGTFRKEGDYWTVGCGGKSVPLKEARGFGYLVHLLRHPGVEFHVLDLVGGIAGQREDDEPTQSERALPRGEEDLEKAGIHITSLGDAGEMLDEQAKAAYKRRLSELHGELEEAKQLGRVERAEEVESEIDALTKELSRAVGLGGVTGGRHQRRSARGRVSPSRSGWYLKESPRATPRLETSSRAPSEPAPSAPTSLTPISR